MHNIVLLLPIHNEQITHTGIVFNLKHQRAYVTWTVDASMVGPNSSLLHPHRCSSSVINFGLGS